MRGWRRSWLAATGFVDSVQALAVVVAGSFDSESFVVVVVVDDDPF